MAYHSHHSPAPVSDAHLTPSELQAMRSQLPPAMYFKIQALVHRHNAPFPLHSPRSSNDSEQQTMYKQSHVLHHRTHSHSTQVPFSPPGASSFPHKVRSTPTSSDTSALLFNREAILSETIEEEPNQPPSDHNLLESIISLNDPQLATVEEQYSSRQHSYPHSHYNSLPIKSPTNAILLEPRREPSSEHSQQRQFQYSENSVPLSSRGHAFTHFQREEQDPRSFHISKLSASKSHYSQTYMNDQGRSEKRQKLKKDRTISLIKKLQQKNQAAFSFRETLLQQLRQRFARFAACALRMKRPPPGHSRKSYISTTSIDSSKSNFLQSGSLDIRDILVNYISKDKKPPHSSHHAIRRHVAAEDSRTTLPHDRSEIDLPGRKLFRDSQSFTDGYPLPTPDVSGTSVPPSGLSKGRGNNTYSSSETERAGVSRFARYHRKSSLVTPSPLNNINSARSNRGQSQPEVQFPLNSYRERQCHNFTPLQDTVHYPTHYSQQQQPQLSTPVKYHIQSYLEKQQRDKQLQLSDFLSLAQCQRCHHTQLTLITTSTQQQLSPTFVEKVRALIPAVGMFSTDQSTVTPDMTTALQSAIKTDEQKCVDIRESKGGKYGKSLQSPKPSGRRINPYEDEGCSSAEQKESMESQEEDLRNFFMDGLYLSSEKKQSERADCQTPLDAGEINQLTQIGDELVDSFYKLSDTLGTSQGLLQQAGSQAQIVPSVIEQIVPVSTARSHRRQNSSSILSSVCEPILKCHRISQSEQQTMLSKPRYDESHDERQSRINASQRIKKMPNETDMSLVIFGDDSLMGLEPRTSAANLPPRSGSVNSHYSQVNNSIHRVSQRKIPREMTVNAVSSTNPFDSPDSETLRDSQQLEEKKQRQETTRRSLSAEPKNAHIKIPTLSEEQITRNLGVCQNVPTARFKETGCNLKELREEERRLSESRSRKDERLESEISKMKCGVDALGLFPQEISEIVHYQGDTPFLLDMEELENVESGSGIKGPSCFILEKSESKYDSSPEGGLPAPRGVSQDEKVYSKCSNTHTKVLNRVHPGISMRQDLSFEKQSCLELPSVSPFPEAKAAAMSQKVSDFYPSTSTRRSSIEISNFAEAPKRMSQTRPHAQHTNALNSLITSSRESSTSNSRSQGISCFSKSSNCQERLHSANIVSTRTSDISQEPKKTDISPKPFKIPKSAVQPKTQRNFKIAGFTRALKKFSAGGPKAPSPPLKSSSRTLTHFGKRKSLAASKISKTAADPQVLEEQSDGVSPAEAPQNAKQKLASTISSLLGSTSSYGGTKKNTDNFLNFSGTMKKKSTSGLESANAIELLFQKKLYSQEYSRQNVPPLQLQDLAKKGQMESTSRSKRSTREGMKLQKRGPGVLRVKKVHRSNSEERK